MEDFQQDELMCRSPKVSENLVLPSKMPPLKHILYEKISFRLKNMSEFEDLFSTSLHTYTLTFHFINYYYS